MEFQYVYFGSNITNRKIAEQHEAITPKITFKIMNANRRKSELYFTDINAHSEMMAQLREGGINSYSFTPKELILYSAWIALYNNRG